MVLYLSLNGYVLRQLAFGALALEMDVLVNNETVHFWKTRSVLVHALIYPGA